MRNYKTTLVVVVILDYVSNHSISMKFFAINNIMLMKIQIVISESFYKI